MSRGSDETLSSPRSPEGNQLATLGYKNMASLIQDGKQCDQIGLIIELWATFQSMWQQLFCPNHPHFCNFCEGVKMFQYSSETIFRQLL